jgi:hypothetical protein
MLRKLQPQTQMAIFQETLESLKLSSIGLFSMMGMFPTLENDDS